MTTPTYTLGGTTGDFNAHNKSYATLFDDVGWSIGENLTSVAIRSKDSTGPIRAFLYSDDGGIDTVLWSSIAQTPGVDLTWTTFDIADGSPTSITVPTSKKLWLVTNFSTSGTYGYSIYKAPDTSSHCEGEPNTYTSMPISPFSNITSTGSYMNCGITIGTPPPPVSSGPLLPPPIAMVRL